MAKKTKTKTILFILKKSIMVRHTFGFFIDQIYIRVHFEHRVSITASTIAAQNFFKNMLFNEVICCTLLLFMFSLGKV